MANALTRMTVALYRRTSGRLGGRFLGVPVLLLEHVGRRTGQRRATPLHYMRHDGGFVVVGSRGGSDVTPAWWLNLEAAPAAAIQIRGTRIAVTAREATVDERALLWPELLAINPAYATYQQRTDRRLPVIVLTPSR